MRKAHGGRRLIDSERPRLSRRMGGSPQWEMVSTTDFPPYLRNTVSCKTGFYLDIIIGLLLERAIVATRLLLPATRQYNVTYLKETSRGSYNLGFAG